MSKIMNSKFKCKIMENQAQIKQSKNHSLILIVLMMLVLPFVGFSQDFKIVNVNDFFKAEQQLESARSSNSTTIKSLIKDLHPSIYVTNGLVNSYGKSPKVLFIDTKSISKLNELKLEMNQVELVTVKITKKEDLLAPIDLDIFSGFPSVKVIYLTVSFDCTVDMLYNLIKTNKSKYTIIYEIVKPT